jgi:hypothetical protein
LRASRETELVEKYPVQVVTAWLGNTPSVAMRHYLMTTDEHFDAAVKDDAGSPGAARAEARALPLGDPQNKRAFADVTESSAAQIARQCRCTDLELIGRLLFGTPARAKQAGTQPDQCRNGTPHACNHLKQKRPGSTETAEGGLLSDRAARESPFHIPFMRRAFFVR